MAQRTLARYLTEEQRTKGAITGDLKLLIEIVSRACQAISIAIGKGASKTAPKIAEHRQPPFAEKMRILAFAGSNAGRFKRFDEQTHQAANALEQAARRSDGQAVIASFATLQNSCLACHQDFRKPFVEHFYGQP